MNINMIKGSKNTTNKLIFYAEIDSDIQKIQFILSLKKVTESGFVNYTQ